LSPRSEWPREVAALQPEPPGVVERDPRVGAVELLLDHAVRAAQLGQRDLREVMIAGLQPAAFEVVRAWVAMDRVDHRAATLAGSTSACRAAEPAPSRHPSRSSGAVSRSSHRVIEPRP
jgi:hypothetical protein